MRAGVLSEQGNVFPRIWPYSESVNHSLGRINDPKSPTTWTYADVEGIPHPFILYEYGGSWFPSQRTAPHPVTRSTPQLSSTCTARGYQKLEGLLNWPMKGWQNPSISDNNQREWISGRVVWTEHDTGHGRLTGQKSKEESEWQRQRQRQKKTNENPAA